MSELARYSLEWRRRDIPCPGPTILAEMIVPRGARCPAEIEQMWKPGAGYAICWGLVSQRPIRRWSREAKARARRRNLQRRIEAKFPLFAQIFISAELERRPAYYDADDPA